MSVMPRFVTVAVAAVLTAIPIGTIVHMVTNIRSEPKRIVLTFPTPTPAAKPPHHQRKPVSATATPVPTPTSKPQTTKEYTGEGVHDVFGVVQASIRVKDNRIVEVSVLAPEDNPRSFSINAVAVPILKSETLSAQDANIDGVTGATQTSEAYAQSLQSALSAAGLR